MAFDYKKEYKEFYMPKNKPGIIEIPQMNYIAVRGKGNPNEEKPPLEGLWWQENTHGLDYTRKEDMHFISMIRLPDFVTKEDLCSVYAHRILR